LADVLSNEVKAHDTGFMVKTKEENDQLWAGDEYDWSISPLPPSKGQGNQTKVFACL